jgi:hypothetical protein
MQIKFSNDPRNGRAAEMLYQLASEANDLTDENWRELQTFLRLDV